MGPATKEQAKVLGRRHFSNGVVRLDLESSTVARAARAGQFVMVRVKADPGYDPLLRRPLSIHDRQGKVISLLVKVVGRGTAWLADLGVDDSLDLLGPLGRPFPSLNGPKILVGGGMGVAPLLFLAREAGGGNDLRLRLGAATATELLAMEEFEGLGLVPDLYTEDGSAGAKGLVTKGLAQELGRWPGIVFACGPPEMLRAVAEIARESGVQAYLSLEAHMGCGLGACLGCAVRKSGGGYARVCTEGPVFEATEVEI